MEDPYLKRDNLKAELDKVEAEIERREALAPEQKLAEALHDMSCAHNHTDMCGWFYESWEKPSYARSRYLRRAREAIKILSPMGLTIDDMIEIARVFKGY